MLFDKTDKRMTHYAARAAQQLICLDMAQIKQGFWSFYEESEY